MGVVLAILSLICIVNADWKRRSREFLRMIENTRLRAVSASKEKPTRSEMTQVPTVDTGGHGTVDSRTMTVETESRDVGGQAGVDSLIVYDADHRTSTVDDTL